MKMLLKPKSWQVLTIILLLTIAFALSSKSSAEDIVEIKCKSVKDIEFAVGKSIVLKSSKSVKRVSIADPEIANFVLISPHEIYVTGNKHGSTNLTLWHKKQILGIYNLEVVFDVSRLKQKINAIVPGEKDINVMASGDSITLSGRVSSTVNLSRILALAETYAPKENIRNLVEVAGVHQVMLEVRVAEISRNLTRQMGVNFSYTRGEDFGVSLLNNLVQLVDPDDANVVSGISRAVLNRDGVLNPLGFLNPPGLEALFRFQKGSAQWTGFVDALKENGMIKILAEPTLIALSGQTAEFLAGGEFPYPVPQGLGTVAIEYKSFGVGLAFTPTVLANDKISMKVQPEVSDLDYTTGVTIQGFTIPGINTRRVSTVIELGDGQSFSIAGLLKENVRESIAKYPFLGDIPVLGNLFKSSRFTKGETELVIIVTPHLVKPVDQEEQKLPTDYYIEPNDLDFYLLGTMWRRLKSQPAVPQAELEGDFGHSIPIN